MNDNVISSGNFLGIDGRILSCGDPECSSFYVEVGTDVSPITFSFTNNTGIAGCIDYISSDAALRGSNGIIAAGNPQCLPHNGIVVTGSESASFATKAEGEASGSQLDATPNNCASKIGARALGLLNPGMVGTLQDVTVGSDICSGLCYSVCYGPQLQVQDTSASFTQWLDTAVSFDAASGNVIIDVWVNQPEGDKRIDVISFNQLPSDNTLPTSTCNNLDGLAANLVPSSDDVTNQVDNNAKFVAAEGTPLAGTHWVAQTNQARDIKVGGVTQVSATGMKHYRYPFSRCHPCLLNGGAGVL